MSVRISAPYFAAALLAWMPAFAQTGECPPAGATDGGATGEAEGCPNPGVVPLGDGSASGNKRDDRERGAEPVAAADSSRHERWGLDLAVVIGQAYRTTFASGLTTFRVRLLERLGLGVVMPFSFGTEPGGAAYGCYGDMCPSGRGQDVADFGNVSIFAAWESVLGPYTRLTVGAVVAFPTSYGNAHSSFGDHALVLGGPTRGFEDVEFFLRRFGAVAPSLGVSQGVGPVDLGASMKLRFLLGDVGGLPAFVFGAVGTAQVMVRLLEQPEALLSVGVRAVGVLWAPVDQAPYLGEPPTGRADVVVYPSSVTVEPRGEARVGAFEFRAGVVIPVAYRAMFRDEVRHFPDAWGLRLGVGYSF